jgi:hypothetical protein
MRMVCTHGPPFNPLLSRNHHLSATHCANASTGLLDKTSRVKQFPDIGRQIIQQPLRQVYKVLLIAAAKKSRLSQRS